MQASRNVSSLILIGCIGIQSNNFALAGTTQIYSPSGLPKSSSQDYSIPTTTVTPQTFPTPPIPLGDTGLQGFSSIPLRNEITTTNEPNKQPSKIIDNKNLKQSSDKQSNQLNPTQSGSVESFFQCTPLISPQQTVQGSENKVLFGSFGKLIWHTLDNIGVPMFVSKENDLDPSLRAINNSPPQNKSDKADTEAIHQRIPQSEFEGTDIPLKDNEKLQ